jgi:hypothetical protein
MHVWPAERTADNTHAGIFRFLAPSSVQRDMSIFGKSCRLEAVPSDVCYWHKADLTFALLIVCG